MSQNISFIRKELKSCEEVESPYDIKVGDLVKYITLKDGSEFFYTGGNYVKMGDNKILLKSGVSTIYVPLTFPNPDGTIFYRTRLFVENKESECGGKENEEYEKIIHAQQQIIEKMNLQMKKQAMLINKLTKK